MSSNPSSATAGFRLSRQQEWAWTQQERGVGQCAQCIVRVSGKVDSARVERALQQLVAKHEILRTRFRRQTGVKLPFQVIFQDTTFRFQQVSTGESHLDGIAERERLSSPNLDQDSPLRAVLATDGLESRLIITLPALCADAATFNNLVRELAAAYDGNLGDSDAMQYADLVEWQNEMLASDETKAGRDFWRALYRDLDFAALESATLPLEQKTDAAFAPASHPVVSPLDGALASAAKALNTSHQDLLLAAWNALLFRLTGEPAITMGCEVDGRSYEELASALGPLARCLPLPVTIAPQSTFRALLEQVRALTTDAQNWQESFAWNQTAGVEMPALPFTFASHDIGVDYAGSDMSLSLERVHILSEAYRLRLVATRRGADLWLEFHYDTSRLTRAAVERIAGYYQNLLAGALANPDAAVSRLPLLSPTQRRQLLLDWNSTQGDYPRTLCLHQLFEQQAARNPERIAVLSPERAYSYCELNQGANQLAHYLLAHGVGPDRPVGLCLERSADSLLAILAILKAGGAYLPLNPDNPPARMQQQLADAAAIITEAKLADKIPAGEGRRSSPQLLLLDRDQSLWANQPKSNPALNVTPENLVYILYTSGSTGVPKGVCVRHRNLVNYAHFITQRLELDKHRDGLQFATVSTLSADLGNTCIYPALISGGTLHILPYEMATDPQRLAAYVAEHPIDVLKIVPSHLQALLQGEQAARLLPRRYLIFGGETLTPKLLEKIQSLHPSCEILNHYGPTETTVGSLTLKLREYDWQSAKLASIPLGKPIANTQVYILDQNLEPVPIGVTGELYIAGAGVSAGYLGQPEKTAERFVQNPFANPLKPTAGWSGSPTDSKATMYRTGDRARYGEDGNLEFLGRGDDQVKVRGFRIELGEIEATLARHAAVKQAVALARENENGDKRLLAYVVLGHDSASANVNGNPITEEDLRTHLKQQLPDYMLPQAVMILQKLPLTANGKIDRQALPEPEQAQAKAYVAPRTATEQIIAQIWGEVFRRPAETISVDDNFFDLGGHSLIATQVVSRLRRALKRDIPLRTLFEAPLLGDLAERLSAQAAGEAEIHSIVKVDRDQPLPLSFAQQRLWVLDRIQPNNPLYNIARGRRLRGELNTDALIRALNEIVRRHESLRTTFAEDANGNPVQVTAETHPLPVPVMDLAAIAAGDLETKAQEIAAAESRTPFDLKTGPLLRAVLLKISATDHILLLTMHHIVSDAWSAGVFFNELSALYEAFAAGNPSPLPALPVQYADYAVWQRQFLQGAVLEKQLAYWREHLKGAPPVLQLPTDFPHPSPRTFSGAWEPIPLAKEVTAALRGFSQAQNVTPFMILLAGFSAMLSRYSGADHIVLGTDIANRTSAETEQLIGFFINLLPLHTDLSGDPTFNDLMDRVREVALGAYAHQEMPFDKLVHDLRPERSSSHNPIVQSLFVMQNIPNVRRELPGLKMEWFPTPVTHSKFDVAVFMTDGGAEMTQHWVYSTELFECATIRRMASHFENLLRQALSQPNSRLSAIDMLTEEEQVQREQETRERKQSQRRKLRSAEPKAVALPEPSDEK